MEINHNFKKKFGQNFLTDKNLLDSIVTDAGITNNDIVLEIGAGMGALTEPLSRRAKKVVSFEIDEELIPQLTSKFECCENVQIVFQDFLNTSPSQITDLVGTNFKVVANLPYYITTPIIMGLFEGGVPLESITIMVQKEVADRMQVGPGTKDYGALSLAVQYYAKPEVVLNVPASCFMPRPNVDSAVIKLERYKKPPVDVSDEHLMFGMIRASFNQRRKTMTNSVCSCQELKISKELLLRALEACDMSATIRGEALSLEEFATLTNEISRLREENI